MPLLLAALDPSGIPPSDTLVIIPSGSEGRKSSKNHVKVGVGDEDASCCPQLLPRVFDGNPTLGLGEFGVLRQG
jgi:hypothetical protein